MAGELSSVRKQMEAEVSRLEREKQLQAQKLIQMEEEAQATLRTRQAAHEEDVACLRREKVCAASGPVYWVQRLYWFRVRLSYSKTEQRTYLLEPPTLDSSRPVSCCNK